MVNWDKLKYFYYVADECSMTKAAARINISQTSISKHIKDLESHYNHELFLRKSDGLELTLAGRDLFNIVKIIYDKALEADKRFYKKEEEVEGDLKIVTTPGIASNWIMDHISHFLNQHPKLNIFLIGTLRTEDFAYKGPMIKIASAEDDSYQVVRDYITTFTMNLYASPEYLKKQGTPKSLKDLVNHRLIKYENIEYSSKGNFNWFLTEEGVEPFMIVGDPGALYSAAANHLGIVELPDQYPMLKEGKLVQLSLKEESPSVKIYCSYLKDFHRSKKIQAFVKALKDSSKPV